jgi:hypothetical protein
MLPAIGCHWHLKNALSGQDLTIPCCDLHDPTLLDHVLPGKPVQQIGRSRNVKKGEVDEEAADQLVEWREGIYDQYHAGSMYTPAAILNDDLIDILCSQGPLERDEYDSLLRRKWCFYKELYLYST